MQDYDRHLLYVVTGVATPHQLQTAIQNYLKSKKINSKVRINVENYANGNPRGHGYVWLSNHEALWLLLGKKLRRRQLLQPTDRAKTFETKIAALNDKYDQIKNFRWADYQAEEDLIKEELNDPYYLEATTSLSDRNYPSYTKTEEQVELAQYLHRWTPEVYTTTLVERFRFSLPEKIDPRHRLCIPFLEKEIATKLVLQQIKDVLNLLPANRQDLPKVTEVSHHKTGRIVYLDFKPGALQADFLMKMITILKFKVGNQDYFKYLQWYQPQRPATA